MFEYNFREILWAAVQHKANILKIFQTKNSSGSIFIEPNWIFATQNLVFFFSSANSFDKISHDLMFSGLHEA